MAAAMGFARNNVRNDTGTKEVGYTTGAANIRRYSNGSIPRPTSRWSVFAAATSQPRPSVAAIWRVNATGSHNRAATGGIPWKTTTATTSRGRAIRASRHAPTTAAVATTVAGGPEWTRDAAAAVTPRAKLRPASTPMYTNNQ